jgi:hypothetical protein
VISTLAGGPGGPEKGTNVAVQPCGVTYADGHLYVSEPGPKRGMVHTVVPGDRYRAGAASTLVSSGAVQQMSPGSGLMAPFAGTYALRGPVVNGRPARGATMSACGAAEDHWGNLVIADLLTCRARVVAGSTDTFYGQAMTAGDIYTVAGDGSCAYSGNGGLATHAGVDPAAVQVDAAGNLVIADVHNRVRVVAATTGTFYGQAMTAGDIYSIAGNGIAGFTGDGGPATGAELNQPASLVLDTAGNVVIVDTGNCRIRVVAATTGTFYGQAMTAGDIYSIAGNGSCTFSGDGGSAASAGLDPEGIAIDGARNLLITGNNRVRVYAKNAGTLYGQPMRARHIYTVAGNGTAGFAGDGGPATGASLNNPEGVTVEDGNVVVADSLNYRIRVVAESTGTFYGKAMTAGNIYTIAGDGTFDFSGDGGRAAAAEFHNPSGLAVSGDGNMAVVDYWDNRIRLIPATTGTFFGKAMKAGHVYTIAGNGGDGPSSPDGTPGTKSELNDPAGVAMDATGNLVIADTESCRVQVVADHTGTFYGIAMKAGDIYYVAGNGHVTRKCVYSGNGGPALGTGIRPLGVAVDATGNLVIADNWNCRILVVADHTGTFYGIAMTAGHIYAVAGTGTCGYSGDGGPGTSAGLNPSPGTIIPPFGLAVDAAGNILIPDSGNQRVRVIAATTGTFYGQAMTAGDIYSIAGTGTAGFTGDGGPATRAQLSGPTVVAIDASGNLLIADHGNDRVRMVAATTGTFYGQAMTAGNIYTIAGTGKAGFTGDGGSATRAQLSGPTGLAVDYSGSLLIADGDGNNRIREVAG